MTERSSPNIALMSLMAGVAGAGIALLLAPRSGRETREKISQRSHELKDQAEDSYQKAMKAVNTKVDKTRESLTDALSKTKRAADEQYHELRHDSERTANKQSPVLRAWEEEV